MTTTDDGTKSVMRSLRSTARDALFVRLSQPHHDMPPPNLGSLIELGEDFFEEASLSPGESLFKFRTGRRRRYSPKSPILWIRGDGEQSTLL